jgi:hypothetical protein
MALMSLNCFELWVQLAGCVKIRCQLNAAPALKVGHCHCMCLEVPRTHFPPPSTGDAWPARTWHAWALRHFLLLLWHLCRLELRCAGCVQWPIVRPGCPSRRLARSRNIGGFGPCFVPVWGRSRPCCDRWPAGCCCSCPEPACICTWQEDNRCEHNAARGKCD